jgi:hypothetical protein
VCACHKTGACGESGHTAPRHCKACGSQSFNPQSQREWLLPLRCRWGTIEQDWATVLTTICFPSADRRPNLLLPPAAMIAEAAHAARTHTAALAAEEEQTVKTLYRRIPRALRDTLMDFQAESVRFALRRGGRVLLADEMGVRVLRGSDA